MVDDGQMGSFYFTGVCIAYFNWNPSVHVITANLSPSYTFHQVMSIPITAVVNPTKYFLLSHILFTIPVKLFTSNSMAMVHSSELSSDNFCKVVEHSVACCSK
uniref:Putative vacuolar protein sorting-associated protein 13A n=1 Tax=Anthurium amnicola TaxID=1678845 RepID=A0A1D1YXA9_9ARAE